MWLQLTLCIVAVMSTSCVLGVQCDSAQELDTSVGVSEAPAVLAREGGGHLVAWTARGASGRYVTRAAVWRGCDWDRLGGDLATLAGGTVAGTPPALAALGGGVVLLTVEASKAESPYGSVRLRRWSDPASTEGSWEPLGHYDSPQDGTPRVLGARLRVDSAGAPWVFVALEPLSAGDPAYVLLRWNGSALVEAMPSPAAPGEGGVWFDFVLDSADRPVVGWASDTQTDLTAWTGDGWHRHPGLAFRAVDLELDAADVPLVLFTHGPGCVVSEFAGTWQTRTSPVGAHDDGVRECQQLTVDPELGVVVGWTEFTAYERPGIYVRRWTGGGWEAMASAVRDSDDATRFAFATVPGFTTPVMAWTEIPLGADDPALFVRVPVDPRID